MYAFSGEGIQIHWQSSHESLTFTSGHLSDLTLVQHDTADDLAVVVNHVPSHHIATSHPAVLEASIVALDGDMLVFGSQLTVEVGGFHHHGFMLTEVFGGGFHHSEGFGEDVVQRLLDLFKLLFLELVDLGVDLFLFVGIHVRVGLNTGFQLVNLSHLVGGFVFDIFLELNSLMSDAVNVEFHDLLISLECLL